MQTIIQIYPCLLKLSRKQDTILNIGDFPTTSVNMDRFECFACGLLLSLSWMGSYMEIFEARVLGEIYIYIRGLHSVQSVIGSYIRSWERPGDLPRVKYCTFNKILVRKAQISVESYLVY
jgi:hypothetical protein